jgi:hypothetical protein
LLCIGEVRFKVLRDYVRKSLFFYKGRKNTKRPKPVSTPADKYELKIGHSRQSYEGTKVWETRESLFWQWRRVREWSSQFDEPVYPERILKSILKEDMV